ncbi:MAG: hypothetical protein JWM95_2625, partial [Gemmatimonadetes bacterium]|nr:hypothetical protein [Gemmatimonadota bacterium]
PFVKSFETAESILTAEGAEYAEEGGTAHSSALSATSAVVCCCPLRQKFVQQRMEMMHTILA